jgi:hypothetical protein
VKLSDLTPTIDTTKLSANLIVKIEKLESEFRVNAFPTE